MRTALAVIPLYLFATLHPAAIAQSDRIAARIDDRQLVVLAGNVHPKAKPEYDRGRVEPLLPLEDITLVTRPSPEQQASLERLLGEQQDPASPAYHKWLTPEQYADRFGLSPSDMEKLTVWLRSAGFTVVQEARGRDWIAFSGAAALVESAFQTEIHYFDVDGETHFANATDPSVPAALAGIVTGFRGLNDFRWKPMGVKVAATGAILPDLLRPFYNLGGQHFLVPDDLATIYDLASLYSAGIDGTGMKLAVVGQTDIALTDIDQFRSGFHLSKNDPVIINMTGHKVSNNDLDEAYLDLEWSGAVARNATILYVNSGNVFDAAVDVIDQDLAPVISMSYGACESANAGFIPGNEPTMKQASVEGITFLASSGDSGAAACDPDTSAVATGGLAVNYPASSPEVTGVGGTEFNEGTGTYWSATNDPANLNSALSYIPEMAWNDTAQNGALSASGGGASSCGQSYNGNCTGGFSKPAWQSGSSVPKDGVRDVPDVSMTASADHDGYLLCTTDTSTNPPTHSCGNGVANDNFIVGGTSASTPVFAGIVALLNQSLGNVPPVGVGNINPTLYGLAQTASNKVFHDVTTGDNKVPCSKGSTGCPNGGSIGYSAGPGYDQVTGLGSVDANTLVAVWDASAGKKSPTTTSLSLMPSTIVASASVSFTADVAHAAGAAVPSGTVTFNNGTTKLGSASLNSSAQATFQTSSLAGGTYSVMAAYSGDSNYTASTSVADILTVEDFATPTANPTTVNVTAPGQSGTTTVTITPISGFNQAVTFSCGGLPAEAACSFNPSSVTPNGKAVTTTLMITTMAASAGLREQQVGHTAPFYALFLPGLLGLVVVISGDGKRKWRGMRGLWLTSILCVLIFWLPSCGGGGGGGGSGNSGTPVGNSTVTITATASSTLAHSVQITLSVQ